MKLFNTKLVFFYSSFVVILLSNIVLAQNDECFGCHSDNELTYERNGKTISLFVEQPKYEISAHGKLNCVDCHSGFNGEEIPHKAGKDIYKVDCGKCHTEFSAPENDFHYKLLKDKKGVSGPTCLSCHGSHYVKKTTQVNNKSKEYCSQCHESMPLISEYHRKQNLADNSCQSCHDETTKFAEMLASTPHKDFACIDCHSYVANNFELHQKKIPNMHKADCYLCHSDVAKIHGESIHGISLMSGINEAAQCWNCHGSHDIKAKEDPQSRVNPKNLATTCGSCHDNPEFVKKFSLSIKSPGTQFANSVHGKLVEQGRLDAASCVKCHGDHDIKNRVQEGSKISSFNIPTTCGECHSEIAEEYQKSIHWIRAKQGVRESPVCNDCHSEHSIQAINILNKRSEMRRIQENTCVSCHQNPLLATRYGFEGSAATQYQDSYHGLAVIRGDEDAAFCIDCHTPHKILPKSHPESSVHESNVKATCQKCHADATEVFAKSYSHKTQSESAQQIESFVTQLYTWLIILVIGGMVVHNLVIFIYEIRKRRQKDKKEISIPRFTLNEVIQHILLFTSFIILAITGFALKYPNSWWSEGLLNLGMTETVRQNIHRGSALLMMGLGLYHIIYLFATARGRDVLKNLLPTFDDITTFRQNIFYYLKLSNVRPEFDKYDYAEKAEYWALIWGTLVMGVTGLFLWFPTLVGDWAPTWLIKVSEIIHFYEAILASLAILVWHWFFVIFHPKEYPMSFTWVDGKMSLHHYRHHHDKHFKKIVIEWMEMKKGIRDEKRISHSTKLFADTLHKHGLKFDDIIESEMNNDYQFRNYIESKMQEKPDDVKK